MSNGEAKPDAKTSKGTAQFIADEIREAHEQSTDAADKSADRLFSMSKETIQTLKESNANALAAEANRTAFYLRLAYGMGALFALSLVVNLVLVAGLLRTPVTVSDEGVVIGAQAPKKGSGE